MRGRARRFFVFDGQGRSPRHAQGEGGEAPTSREDAKITEEFQPPALITPTAISDDGGEGCDGLLDNFSLEGDSPRQSSASSPSIRDDLELDTCIESPRQPAASSASFRDANVDSIVTHEISPLHADDPSPGTQQPQVHHPSYEALRGELTETKELLADVMSQHGEYELIIGKMALIQNQRLAELKAAHEQECKLLVDLVTGVEKSCGDRLEDMHRQNEETKRALVAEADELRQKITRTEGSFDLYVINLKSNHEKHISELREELLNQEKEMDELREAQASFGTNVEAAQKAQQRYTQSSVGEASTEGILLSTEGILMSEPIQEKSVQNEISRCEDDQPFFVDAEVSELPMTLRRERELHAKYGSFISVLHTVHREECGVMEKKLSEQERELKQLNMAKKAMEQKSTNDFQVAVATIVDDYNQMIADANAANKGALKELNKRLVQKVEQIAELSVKNADQKAAIEATRRDLKEAVLKSEDQQRVHKSEATALSNVIAKLHAVHTEECDGLRDEISNKDEEVKHLAKEKAYLESSLKSMTKTLEAIAGTGTQEDFSDAPFDQSSL